MKVMLAIPSYGGISCQQFIKSLSDTLIAFTREGIEWEIETICGNCYIQVARNQLVHKFLKSDCDKILFLDDDISWDPDAAIAIVQMDRPISAGIYPMKAEDLASEIIFPVVFRCTDDGLALADGPYICAARAATGFLCVERRVFVEIMEANPHLSYVDRDEQMFDFFPQGVKGTKWVGEDYAFCDLWGALGGSIAVMPDLTFGHHKRGKSWYGNLWAYAKQLPGGIDHGREDAEKAVWVSEEGC